MSVLKAFAEAEHGLSRFDFLSDRELCVAEVHRLTDAGVSAAAIAGLLGTTERSVQRMRQKERPQPPSYPNSADLTDDHAAELERMTDVVFHLAVRLRDEHPQLVWDTLAGLSRRQLQEMTVILLAAIPVDKFSKRQLFDWVLNLPAARYQP